MFCSGADFSILLEFLLSTIFASMSPRLLERLVVQRLLESLVHLHWEHSALQKQ